MNKLFLLLACFVSGIQQYAYSQSYKEYYELINSAELSVSQNNFNEALDDYSLAFKIAPKNSFCRDLFNAAVVSQEAGNIALAKSFLRNFLVNGGDIIFIKKHRKFKRIYNSEKQVFDSIVQINDKKFVHVRELYDLDQRIRMGKESWTKDTIIRHYLETFLKKGTLPTEDLISFKYGADLLRVFLTHQRDLIDNYDFINLVNNGYLNNNIYALLMDMKSLDKSNSLYFCYFDIFNNKNSKIKIHFDSKNPPGIVDELGLDVRRASIYLPPLAQQRKVNPIYKKFGMLKYL